MNESLLQDDMPLIAFCHMMIAVSNAAFDHQAMSFACGGNGGARGLLDERTALARMSWIGGRLAALGGAPPADWRDGERTPPQRRYRSRTTSARFSAASKTRKSPTPRCWRSTFTDTFAPCSSTSKTLVGL